jgi:hypothetical protein
VARLAAGSAGERAALRGAAQLLNSPNLERAIERAEAALLLVVGDIEATTSIRGHGSILRYGDWVGATAETPPSRFLADEGPGDAGVSDDEEEGLLLACEFGGHSFSLDGVQSTAEMAAEIAIQLQDDVMDNVWGAWPVCRQHEHPMSPEVVVGVAVWRCPIDPGAVVPVGQLGAVGNLSPPSDPSSSPPE